MIGHPERATDQLPQPAQQDHLLDQQYGLRVRDRQRLPFVVVVAGTGRNLCGIIEPSLVQQGGVAGVAWSPRQDVTVAEYRARGLA